MEYYRFFGVTTPTKVLLTCFYFFICWGDLFLNIKVQNVSYNITWFLMCVFRKSTEYTNTTTRTRLCFNRRRSIEMVTWLLSRNSRSRFLKHSAIGDQSENVYFLDYMTNWHLWSLQFSLVQCQILLSFKRKITGTALLDISEKDSN